MSNRPSYSRSEVERLMAALERQLSEATKLSRRAEADAAKQSFSAYRAFRDKVGEFYALTILIERRLRYVEGGAGDLTGRYERAEVQFLALLVHASMRFFFVMSANTVLPLGVREVFVEELRSLHTAHEKLRSPGYLAKLSPDIVHDLDLAEQILGEIIDKAPSLLQFEG